MFAVSYAPQNKPRFAASYEAKTNPGLVSYEPKTNPGLL